MNITVIAILPTVGYAPFTLYFSFLAVPFAFQAIRYAHRNYNMNSADIIPSNAHTAINHLFNGLLLVFAFLLVELNIIVPILYMIASLILIFWVWRYIERQRRVMNDFRLFHNNTGCFFNRFIGDIDNGTAKIEIHCYS